MCTRVCKSPQTYRTHFSMTRLACCPIRWDLTSRSRTSPIALAYIFQVSLPDTCFSKLSLIHYYTLCVPLRKALDWTWWEQTGQDANLVFSMDHPLFFQPYCTLVDTQRSTEWLSNLLCRLLWIWKLMKYRVHILYGNIPILGCLKMLVDCFLGNFHVKSIRHWV